MPACFQRTLQQADGLVFFRRCLAHRLADTLPLAVLLLLKLPRSFAHITVLMGMVIMGAMGVLMYLFAPQIIGLMTPVEEIRTLA